MSYLPDYKEPEYPSDRRRREEEARMKIVRADVAEDMKKLGQLCQVVTHKPIMTLRIVK